MTRMLRIGALCAFAVHGHDTHDWCDGAGATPPCISADDGCTCRSTCGPKHDADMKKCENQYAKPGCVFSKGAQHAGNDKCIPFADYDLCVMQCTSNPAEARPWMNTADPLVVRGFVGAAVANGQQDSDPRDIASDRDFPKFEEFIRSVRGGTGYSSEIETVGRFNIFKTNLRLAEERHKRGAANAKPGQKPETHGVTQFMDLTAQEFSAKVKGLIPSKHTFPLVKVHANATGTASSIDWNARGALTAIKNQGQCGSCWAFSATEQLESQYYQKYGTLKVLSPQQATSCDTTCNGCGGGNPIEAWGYVSSFGGQELNTDYPYTSGTTGQTGTCKSKKADIAEDVGQTYTLIASQASQESNMLAQIQESPMSVCVDAELWQTYKGGVITASSGCGTSIDHAVQATGYNAEGNYWIVRNSWGPSFGENGFVWVEYGSNVCGITAQATIVSVATVEKLQTKVLV